MLKFITFTLTVLICTLPFSARATELQDPQSIRAAVDRFVSEHVSNTAEKIEVEINDLDKRLRLPRCGQALEPFMSNPKELRGRIAVGVRCNGPKPWKLYVGAYVRHYGDLLVAKQALPRGAVLTAADLKVERAELTQLHQGYYQTMADAIGMVTKRSLAAGKAITPDAVDSKRLVQRGDRVTIEAKYGGIEVRMRGEAMRDGSNGERISVKNLSSERIIEGIVTSQGVVSVVM